MVEAGHVPPDQIAANNYAPEAAVRRCAVLRAWPACDGCCLWVHHITSAIGGAAAMSGADFLCYVTPTEHPATQCRRCQRRVTHRE